jgi:hypothetical protein
LSSSLFVFIHSSCTGPYREPELVVVETLSLNQKQPKKKPCAGRRFNAETERRARFSYDGLLELFNYLLTAANSL